MPQYEVRHILVAEGLGILDDHVEDLAGLIHDIAFSPSTMNKSVDDVDFCTGLLLTHSEFVKLGLCSPGAHAACRQDCYRCTLVHPHTVSAPVLLVVQTGTGST